VRRFFSVRPTFPFLTFNPQPPPPFDPSKRPFNVEIRLFPVKHFTSSPIPWYPSPCSPRHPPPRRIAPRASVRFTPMGVILSRAKDLLLSSFSPLATHHSPLSPLESALTKNVPLTPLESALPRIRTYEKKPGGYILHTKYLSCPSFPAHTRSPGLVLEDEVMRHYLSHPREMTPDWRAAWSLLQATNLPQSASLLG
jgi:hypothetical protein